MAKTSKQKTSSASTISIDNDNNSRSISSDITTNPITKSTKTKRTRKSVSRDSPQQRSSIYRGVTRHRWTGRYEAHLWDKNCWNESQNKKGRQVYLGLKKSTGLVLTKNNYTSRINVVQVDGPSGSYPTLLNRVILIGAYDDEAAAAHAFDLAALKYWGQETILNFPLSRYENELKEMEGQSREEYIGSLRRKSSGFSRGVSKYRGVARHHHNGRWEARIGRVFGNKYLYLGTYATQEEAAAAYDMAAIEYRGLKAVTNFDLSRYIKWLRPNQTGDSVNDFTNSEHNPNPNLQVCSFNQQQQSSSSAETSTTTSTTVPPPRPASGATASSALGLLLQSSKFKEMLERTSAVDSPSTSSEQPEPPRRSFPDDIQTYFDCQDSGNFANDHENIFGDYNPFESTMFPCELDA